MLAAQRRANIISLVQEKHSVTVEDLAKAFQVSEMTIRRDLAECERYSNIRRCHGGAVLKGELKSEAEYDKKLASNLEPKRRLASYCATLVSPGMSVYLDAGTTTYCIAEALCDVPDLTIVTNDLKIGLLLQKSEANVIMLGGQMQKSTGSMIGNMTLAALKELRVSVAFVGAACISDGYEAFTPTQEKAYLKRAIHTIAETCYLVTDMSKFHCQALYKIDQLSDYAAVITDAAFTETERKKFAQRGINLVTV